MADSRLFTGTNSLLDQLNILDPLEVAQGLASLDDESLEHSMGPIAERLAQSPELAARFIDQLITHAIENESDLNPILTVLLEHQLTQIKLSTESLDAAINALANNQPELIELFKNLDPGVQQQLGALYVYLQINRGISVDEYFQIAKKLNLAKLPREFWNIIRFGVSNTGHINQDVPATLDLEPQLDNPIEG